MLYNIRKIGLVLKLKDLTIFIVVLLSQTLPYSQEAVIRLKFDDFENSTTIFNSGTNTQVQIQTVVTGSGFMDIGAINTKGNRNVIKLIGDNSNNKSQISIDNANSVTGSQSRSISGWLKLTDHNFKWILNTNGAVNENKRLALQIANGKLRVLTGIGVIAQSPIEFKIGIWNHFAVTYNGSELKLFINGQEVSSDAITLTSNYNFYRLFLSFNGLASDFQIYDYSLSSSTIQYQYISDYIHLNNQFLEIAKSITDHAVLQQDTIVKIWGRSAPNFQVNLIPNWTANFSTTSNSEGYWEALVHTLPADNLGKTLTIVSGPLQTSISDIVFGEVWLCAGQSNMKQILKSSLDHEAAAADANNLKIRVLNTNLDTLRIYEPNFALYEGNWKICDSLEAERFSAVAYHFGRQLSKNTALQNTPIGLVLAAEGSTPAESWMSQGMISAHPELYGDLDFDPDSYKNYPSGMYNTLIHPFKNFTFKGVIWYQGENNRNRFEEYEATFGYLIDDWRMTFQSPDMPFYFVQIAPFLPPSGNSAGVAGIQLAQFNVFNAKSNCGIVVTNDLVPDITNIHPEMKAQVGERLANWALANSYGQILDYSGPLYNGQMTQQGSVASVYFNYANGLSTLDGLMVSDFEIAGTDGVYYPVDQSTIVNTHINLYSSQVTNPTRVRFANSGIAQPNLFDGNQLPTSPFIAHLSSQQSNKEGEKKMEAIKKGMKIYPNPSKNQLNVQIEQNIKRPQQIDIFDLKGSQIISIQQADIKRLNVIDLSFLSPGMYIIKIITQNHIGSRTFVRL